MSGVYQKEVEGLFKTLAKHKIIVGYCNNGEAEDSDVYVTDPDFINEVMACDLTYLYAFSKHGAQTCLMLIYGNEPGVIVADYHDPTDHPGFAASLEAAMKEHYEEWSGDKS